MTNFIIEGDEEEVKRYIENFLIEHKIKSHNVIYYEELVKIDKARDLKKILSFSSNDFRVFIFLSGLTIEAQNSLLKIIEETEKTYFIFYSQDSEEYLPTVVSRCKLIKLIHQENSTDLAITLNKIDEFGFSEIERLRELCSDDFSLLAAALRSLILDSEISLPLKSRYYQFLKRLLKVNNLSRTNNVNPQIVFEYIFAS